MIIDQVRLPAAQLTAEVHRNKDVDYLRLHHRHDLTRDLLLPLRPDPLCGALARFTRLGRLHALYWTLAYGFGSAHRVSLDFSSPTRFGRDAHIDARVLGDRYWIADVEGLYEHVEMMLDRTCSHRLTIPAASRC